MKINKIKLFSRLKKAFAVVRLPKANKTAQNVNFEKPFRSSLHETFLDDMYAQVQDAGRINISQLASRYGLSISMLEEFAKVLDKEKLVELYYPIIGTPVVRKLNYIAELNAKRLGNSNNRNKGEGSIISEANKKQKIINLALFGILTFALVMIGYLVYLNRFAAQ
ncbi:hypothetical protein HYU06_00985 [Candidatus Woesearchaeota archaeon]|nr:hypothetical protein [Candidatus Woesearchaeota archaeon]